MKAVQLGVICFLCKVFLCGFVEESSCTPGFESEFLILKVHRHHLPKGMRLGRVIFNTCNGGRIHFQSTDKRFDVDMDGTVMVKRSVNLHEGHKVFSVNAWDSSEKKHTIFVRVQHQEDYHMAAVMNNSFPQVENLSNDLVLTFPKLLTGLKRAKRCWRTPPLHVPENGRGPFPVKLVQIKEYAAGTEMEYKITGEGADLDPKGTFTIDKKSGTLYVTRRLDRETKASYRRTGLCTEKDLCINRLVLTMNIAIDAGMALKKETNPSNAIELVAHATGVSVNRTKTMEILVAVQDQNDNKPVFVQNPFNGNVPEGAKRNHELMTVTATDADDPNTENADLRYKILSQDPPFPKPKMFEIDSMTGGISVVEAGMDREQWPRYTLVIQVADRMGEGYTTTGKAVITVTDSNDNPPQFDQTSHTVFVPENKVGAEVARLTVTDGDELGSPAWSTKYQIISGDKGGFFSVSTVPSKLEGIITTIKPLDFEKKKQYILSVIVENDDPFVGSLPTSTATVTVNVVDVNEPPEFNLREKVISIPEDSPVDSVLVSYTATDPDVGKTQKITYKIGRDPAGWLKINPDTGEIRIKTLVDREYPNIKDGKYTAYILASDNDYSTSGPVTGTGTLIIKLEDVNDNAPVINERNIQICNHESAPVLLSITDKDGPLFTGPFSVETQGETNKNWTASMNKTSTGIVLRLKSQGLEQGEYNVVLRVYDNQRLYQDNTIQASVCDCTGDVVQCADKQITGIEVFGILGLIFTLLLLVLCLLLFTKKRKSSTKKEPHLPEDDVRDRIYHYGELGSGEDDQVGSQGV